MAIVGGPGLVPIRMTSHPNNANICGSGRKIYTDGDEIRWAVVGQLPTSAWRTHANGLDLQYRGRHSYGQHRASEYTMGFS